MDWSNAKTIFILTFLCLNLFLGYQLNQKQTASKLHLRAEATVQERLQEENITLRSEIKDEPLLGTYLSATIDQFSQTVNFSEVSNIARVEIINHVVSVELAESISFTGEENQLAEFAKSYAVDHIQFGKEYRYSHYDEEARQLLFYQTYEGKRIDNFEEDYPLIIELDASKSIVGYKQMYLTISPEGREQEMISGLKAIEILLNEPLIPSESEIDSVELSYISLFKPLGEIQIFAPMWNVRVNDDLFYVDAIGGVIQNIQ